MHQAPMKQTFEMLAGGYLGNPGVNVPMPSTTYEAGKSLPRNAHVLQHEDHLRLGTGRPTVSDSRGVQGGLSYRRARSPRDLWQQLRRMGVTHVVWPSWPMGLEAYADETVFYAFTANVVTGAKNVGGVMVGALPVAPPSDVPYGPAALLGCSVAHRVPLPDIEASIWTATPPPDTAKVLELAKGVDFILVETPCKGRFGSVDFSGFQMVTSRNGWETWAKK